MNYNSASEECGKKGLISQPVKGIALEEVRWEDLTEESLVWIGNQMHRAGRDESTTRKDQKAAYSPDRSSYCKAWSTRRLYFQTIPCDTELPVFCQADILGIPDTKKSLFKRP
jgi:hypothetical protein